MFLSLSTYRSLLVMALTVLLAMPCFAKSEIKQLLPVPIPQQAKPIQPLTACYSFCEVQEQENKENAEKHTLPTPVADDKAEYFIVSTIVVLPDFYNRQKEKIPSYLLFERFLN